MVEEKGIDDTGNELLNNGRITTQPHAPVLNILFPKPASGRAAITQKIQYQNVLMY